MGEIPLFVYPESLRFTCSQCGDCCRGPEVMLGEEEIKALESLEWSGREPDLIGLPPATRLPLPGRGKAFALTRREDGSCIYLSQDQKCRLHAHFGGEAKPLMCRLFPFGFTALGGRVAVDVSFACRAVREEQGARLSASVAEWKALLGERAYEIDRTKHRFSPKYPVQGELLWELERLVIEMLSKDTLSLMDRVRAVLELVRLGMTSDPRTETAARLRRIMADAIPEQIPGRAFEGQLDETQRAVFFHLVFMSLNPTPRSLLELSGKKKEREVRRRVEAANAFADPDAKPWINNRECSARFAVISDVSLGWLRERQGESLVSRYLSAKVVGQRFLQDGNGEMTFLEAVPRLLLLVPMAFWTAKALAADRNRSRVRRDDFHDALYLIDRSYGHVRLSDLPRKQKQAWSFALEETDLAPTVLHELEQGSL